MELGYITSARSNNEIAALLSLVNLIAGYVTDNKAYLSGELSW